MTTAPTEFFSDQTIQSLTKTRIVSKYFKVWASKLGRAARKRGDVIQYADLFAGRGRYKDGSPSTPILILQHVIDTPALRDVFVGRFNDADPDTATALDRAVAALPGIKALKYPPEVSCLDVDDSVADVFASTRLPPTLTFIDPFGYRGVSARLVRAALKDRGCECILFFNFNRVNAAIDNDCVEDHVRRLFDVADTGALRAEFRGMPPYQREEAVVRRLVEAIKREHTRHVLDFQFLNDEANRTSHYLVFATKNPLGAKIMKDIMAKESSWSVGGTPGFACSPKPRESTLFDDVDPVSGLADDLCAAFARQTLSVANLYFDHGLERRNTPKQYKEALRLLEAQGRLVASPPASQRRDGTMADTVEICFPPQGA